MLPSITMRLTPYLDRMRCKKFHDIFIPIFEAKEFCTDKASQLLCWYVFNLSSSVWSCLLVKLRNDYFFLLSCNLAYQNGPEEAHFGRNMMEFADVILYERNVHRMFNI
jgi:hypothetical protein